MGVVAKLGRHSLHRVLSPHRLSIAFAQQQDDAEGLSCPSAGYQPQNASRVTERGPPGL